MWSQWGVCDWGNRGLDLTMVRNYSQNTLNLFFSLPSEVLLYLGMQVKKPPGFQATSNAYATCKPECKYSETVNKSTRNPQKHKHSEKYRELSFWGFLSKWMKSSPSSSSWAGSQLLPDPSPDWGWECQNYPSISFHFYSFRCLLSR